MRKREVERLVRKITKCVQSPEGRASLNEAKRQTEELIQELRRKRKIDPLTLFERIMI